MLKEPLGKESILNDWFFWGKWDPNLLTVSLWHKAMTSATLKNMEIELSGNMKCLDGSYYFLKSDFEKLHFVLEKNGMVWFEKLLETCELETKSLVNFDGTLEDFLDILHNRFLGCVMLITFSDPWFESKLKAMCADKKVPVDTILQMMQPEQKTLLMEYREELRNINKKDIESFVEKWKWVGTHAFGGKLLTKDEVPDSLNEIISEKSNNPIPTTGEMGNIKDNDLQIMIKIGRNLAFHRSNMVEQMNKAIFKYREIMSDMAEKNKISYEELINHTHEEILELSRGKSILKERVDISFNFIATDEGIEIIFSESFGEENAFRKSIGIDADKKNAKVHGVVACKGIVRGTARVVTEVEDCNKVESGDILIAPETTPDYIHAMQKAAAFVTDQGGITSHAAITAREMNKPCITGTKNATKLFSDGDLVEVDAMKGIVKIIK